MEEQELKTSGMIGDMRSKEDYLGFKPYVLALVSFLTDPNTRPPLTLSVEGEWGSGKSSFLEQLRLAIKTEVNTAICVEFNPWRYNSGEALWAAFAIELERQIIQQFNMLGLCRFFKIYLKVALHSIKWQRLGMDIILILIAAFCAVLVSFLSHTHWGDIIHHAANQDYWALFCSLPVLGGLSGLSLFIGSSSVGDVAKQFSETFQGCAKGLMDFKIDRYKKQRPNYKAKLPFLQEFHEDISWFIKTLSPEHKIYVFVDDLDRCEPDQALELMQAINLLISDELNIIFILAIDRKKVAAGYAAKNAHLMKYMGLETENEVVSIDSYSAVQYGYEFLEKFIQVPFTLPVPTVLDVQAFVKNIIPFTPKNTNKSNSSTSTSNNSASKRQYENNIEDKSAKDVSALVTVENLPDYAEKIVTMVAAALQYNPRRIKKFFNILRLQAYICSQTGFFATRLSNGQYTHRGSLIQLAKIIAISEVWPHFIEQWVQDPLFVSSITDLSSMGNRSPESLERIIRSACLRSKIDPNSSQGKEYWKRILKWESKQLLTDLINFDVEANRLSSIQFFDIRKYRQIAPILKAEKFSIPNGVVGFPLKGHMKQKWDLFTEIVNEVDLYLNPYLLEGQREYQLDTAQAALAYQLRVEGATLEYVKERLLHTPELKFDDVSGLFDDQPGLFDGGSEFP